MSELRDLHELPPEHPGSTGDEANRDRVSRRGFLKIAGALIAASSIGAVASCNPAALDQGAPPIMPLANPELPYAPPIPPSPDVLRFFTVHEAQIVDAITARIMPGSPDDPGAHEAGVVTYIDNLLAYDEGFAEPTYRQAPFAETYDKTPPATANQPGAYQVVYVQADQLSRYGFQSITSPRESYRLGIAALDQYASSKFKAKFIELTPDQQDAIVSDLANGKATGFTEPNGIGFFKLLRGHTIEGMFSDPAYGGNRNMVGWKLIGYPGAQRAYTADEIHNERLYQVRPPQDLAMMHEAHPGQPANANVILPQSGSGTLVPPPMPNNSNMQH